MFPDRVALVEGGQARTYSQLWEDVRGRAAEWRRVGVSSGDRIAALLPNSRRFLEATFAAAVLGAVLMPGNTRLQPADWSGALAHARPKLGVAGLEHRALAEAAGRAAGFPRSWSWLAVDDAPPSGNEPLESVSLAPEAPVNLYYTSGTTGHPKGVVLTAQNITTHALMAIAELGLDERDVWLHAAPMFHLADAWAIWAITAVAGRHVFLPTFEPAAFWQIVDEQAVTMTNLVPTMLGRAVRHSDADPRRAHAFRRILSGGAPIAPALVEQVESAFGCEYVQTYGLTETSPYLTMSMVPRELASEPESDRRRIRARTGRPVIGISLRLVDELGRDVPRDDRTVGEIVVRGPTVSPGYYRAAELTAAAFRDGWFYTGDLAVWDRWGSVNIVDRKKDVILSGGENVYSAEVEAVVLAYPSIAEGIVIGVPDDDLGERVCAVVVLSDEVETLDVDGFLGWCRERLTGFKRPRRVEVVEELPRTGSGKLDKRAVREKFWAGRDRRI